MLRLDADFLFCWTAILVHSLEVPPDLFLSAASRAKGDGVFRSASPRGASLNASNRPRTEPPPAALPVAIDFTSGIAYAPSMPSAPGEPHRSFSRRLASTKQNVA